MAATSPTKWVWRRRKSAATIAVFVAQAVGVVVLTPAIAAPSCQSSDVLQQLDDFDRKVADGLAAHALPSLRQMLRDVAINANVRETLAVPGGDACSCDVAMVSLGLLLSLALAKIDGADQSPDAVSARSNVLGDTLETYQEKLNDCAADAGSTGFRSRIRAQLFEKL